LRGAEIRRSVEVHVGGVVDFGDGVVLGERGGAGADGKGDVVDHVPVARAVDGELGEIGFGGIESVFVAGVVDDVEVLDLVGLDAAATIAVDDVVDDEGRRSVAAEIEDDAVAVGVV
jgi:hypothetical protein